MMCSLVNFRFRWSGMAIIAMLHSGEHRAQGDGIVPFDVDTAIVQRSITPDALGRPDRVLHYILRKRPSDVSESFFHGGMDTDSLVMDTIVLADDRYTWNEAGHLAQLYRMERGRRAVHLFGPPWTIALPRTEVEVIGRVGEQRRAGFLVENRGHAVVQLDWTSVPESIFPEVGQWALAPGEGREAAVKVVLGRGRRHLHLLLGHPDGSIPVLVKSRGYDVRTEDLLEGTGFDVPQQMAYYRTGGETLIEAGDPRTGEVLQRYPVHAEHTLIDLNGVGLDEVELCILDLGLAVRYCAVASVTR